MQVQECACRPLTCRRAGGSLHLHYVSLVQRLRRVRDARSPLGDRPPAAWLPCSRRGTGGPYLSEAVKVRQAPAGTVSVTPSRSVVSRTVTPCAEATSTHCPPLLPL